LAKKQIKSRAIVVNPDKMPLYPPNIEALPPFQFLLFKRNLGQPYKHGFSSSDITYSRF